MAIKVLKKAVTEKSCDMCGKVKLKFFENGSASMGWSCYQSDRWEKTIDIKLSASIPYCQPKDICTDCAKEAFNLIIKNIEEIDQ